MIPYVDHWTIEGGGLASTTQGGIDAPDVHPTKCYTNSKVRALSEKNNSEQVHLQVFRKSRWTNRQVLQFDRQLISTAGTSNSKGSQTPIRPVARHNKIPTNSGSQSRPTRDCRTLGAKSNKVSRSEIFKTLEHQHADFIFDTLRVRKPMQFNQDR